MRRFVLARAVSIALLLLVGCSVEPGDSPGLIVVDGREYYLGCSPRLDPASLTDRLRPEDGTLDVRAIEGFDQTEVIATYRTHCAQHTDDAEFWASASSVELESQRSTEIHRQLERCCALADQGPGPVAVPDLVGLSLDEAQQEAEDLGFRLAIQRVPSDQAAGTVVDQDPPAGTLMGYGDAFKVVVSKG